MLLKIRYLCQKIHKDEWSGVLFYSIEEGTIKDPNNLVLKCQDVLPMDKGTAAATAFNYDERVSSYIMTNAMQNPASMMWKTGLIHSHNSMPVFFSGTDRSELEDNSLHHNFYLSLVVNNYDEFVAKVVFLAKANITVELPYEALDENGEPYKISSQSFNVVREVMYDMDCKIEAPVQSFPVQEEFAGRVSRIITLADEREKQLQRARAEQAKKFPQAGNTSRNVPSARGTDYGQEFSWGQNGEKTSQFGISTSQTFGRPLDRAMIDVIEGAEQFAVYLLLLGDVGPEDTDLTDALGELEQMQVDLKVQGEEVVTNYFDLYNKYFALENAGGDDMEHFFTALSGVIEELENVPEDYNAKAFLNPLRRFQQQMAKKVLREVKDNAS